MTTSDRFSTATRAQGRQVFDFNTPLEELRSSAMLRKDLVDSLVLRPRFTLVQHFAEAGPEPSAPLVRVELVFANTVSDLLIDRLSLPENKCILPLVLEDLEYLVREALFWLEQGGHKDHHYIDLPSISPHPQNRDRGWTRLVALLRLATIQTLQTEPARARALLGHWATDRMSLFPRLVLDIATEHPEVADLATRALRARNGGVAS
jgi:hypothetical protein